MKRVKDWFRQQPNALLVLIVLAVICMYVYTVETLDASHTRNINTFIQRDMDSDKELIEALLEMRRTAVEDRVAILEAVKACTGE